MIEKNRDILKKVLNDLPKRKAASSNWKDISGSLDHLDAKQFFSKNVSSLPKYKAPANAWQGIEKGLKSPLFSFASSRFIKIGSIAVIATALIISFVLFLPDRNKNTENKSELSVLKSGEQTQIDNISAKEIEKEQSGDVIPDKDIIEENRETEIITTNKVSGNGSNSPIIKSGKEDSDFFNSILTDKSKRKKKSSPILRKKDQENTFQNHKLKRIKSRNKIFPDFKFISNILIQKRKKQGKPFSWDYYKKQNAKDFYIGGYYSLINYQNVTVNEMEIPESVSTFGLEVIMEKRKFFFKTGVSYLSWKEKAKYTFNYNQNELVYSYNYVDSAFMDLASGDIEYYTTLKDVFDSVNHQLSDKTKYRYRLLQIPLIVGYKIIENQNFIISLNGGIGFDIRISGQEYLPMFNQEESQIIGTINYLDYRYKLNCRLISGVSVYYKISNKFSFYLEPSYQQYLKSVYKNTRLKNVSYFEIKSGVVYKF